ncbi:GNAT family N-acetyltransferase [Microbacterium sp.]|uniref:GNAT family N-acetyltransferase n=1 Tax=Microbacterium sp. TaxID=51671 RepID=UPI0039E6B0B0
MTIRDAETADLASITAIYNHAVEHTTAIWNEALVDVHERAGWLTQRRAEGFPVIVAVDGSDDLLGYASYGPWRAFSGFRRTVENSVYVRDGEHGRGIGTALMTALISRAREAGLHVIVAAIESGNTGSIALHERLGFTETGRLPQVGEKFGRWLDLSLLQLVLDDSPAPGPAPGAPSA